MHLIGYTSTSKDFDVALSFAFNDIQDEQVPVVYEINFKGQAGLFEMTDAYSAFSDENEVLV